MFFVSASYLITQPDSESSGANPPAPPTHEAAVHALDSIGGYFIENRGPVAEGVRYYSTGNPSIGFRDDGVMFAIRERQETEVKGPERWEDLQSGMTSAISDGPAARSFAYMVRFEGADRIAPSGRGRLPFESNFFIGSDPANWRTGVMNFREIVYEDLYEGIDLVYRLDSRGVKYEFIISPGSDPEAIGMKFEGIESLRTEDGALLLQTPFGVIKEGVPWSYQDGGDEVDCRFAVRGYLSFGYKCESWNRSRPLIVDPLVYSTFLGGSGWEDPVGWARIAIDSLGYVYVTGGTDSIDFPVSVDAFDTTLGFRDVILLKLNPAGSMFVYSTYLGGQDDEFDPSLAIDDEGCVYVTGTTVSNDFPITPGSFDGVRKAKVYEAFVTKLNATGSGLLYSTYFGGSNDDRTNSIAVDQYGNAYVVGYSNSADLPVTPNAFRPNRSGENDTFLTELNANGSALVYSTYFGGTDNEYGTSIAIDGNGIMSFVGQTYSSDLPVTSGAFDTTYEGNGDIFVARMNPATGMLIFSTFVGGGGSDASSYSGIALNSSGYYFVTGMTSSIDFPTTPGSFDTTYNGGTCDSYVFALDSSGHGLVYSTLLGGGSYDVAMGIAADSSGNAYVVGTTYSIDFPTTPGAFSTLYKDNGDMFVTEFDTAGATLEYSTYLNGINWEQGTSIAVDYGGMIYAAGDTDSIDFPTTPGAFDRIHDGWRDISVTKLNPHAIFDPPDLVIDSPDVILDPPASVTVGTPVAIHATVHNFGGSNASDVAVRFNDGPPPGPVQIGPDEVIPFIPYFTGTGTASTVWISGPPGLHTICVVADPDNVINESHEDNNMACLPMEVISQPDLTPRSLGIIPPSPLQEGMSAQVNVTVSNEGDLPAVAFDVLLFDDINRDMIPDTGEQINISSSPGLAGQSQSGFIFDWNATPPGLHSICAYADPPPGTVSESNETNNLICIDVLVQPAPVLRSDYVPVSPRPLPPVRVGMSSPVLLSVQVHNQGNESTTSDAIVAFYEQSSPPFSVFTLNPLAPATNSSRFTATWTSPAIPGAYLVSVDVDYYDDVTEWDETNNVYTWTIEVVSGPITSLVIGSPNYTSPASITYVRSSTPLSFSVIDQSGLGMRNTTYRIDGVAPVNYTATGTFFLAGEREHTVEWRSLDWAGNLEDVSSKGLTVDDTPPATTLSIGDPRYLVGGNFVTPSTPLTLLAVDGGVTPVGLNYTEYRVDGGNWKTYSSPLSLAGEGAQILEYRSRDLLGNSEAVQSMQIVVDDTPPATAISIGEPKYLTGGNFVNSSTPLTLSAADNGVGSNSTFYRLWDGSWSPWRDYSTSFNLAGRDGTWYVEFLSFDYLGNEETVQNETLILDDTPPTTMISPAAPFTLNATDSGCGVNVTMYRIDGGSWTVYTGGFTLTEGEHTIYYYSIDNLGNVEQERSLVVRPPVEVAVNYKPIVAVVFAIILAVVGLWSSKRRPWKGGKDGMEMAKAFAITSLPFVVAEAGTGILSFTTGELRIPPAIGIGTVVDSAILAIGLAVTTFRIIKSRRSP